jgi:Putative Ig domain
MNESNRTRLLGGALVAIVAVWMLRPMVDSWLFEPIRKATSDAKVAREKLDGLAEQEFALAKDKANLKEWKDASLPSDVLIAQRLYQEWITNLAIQCAFHGSDVNAMGKSSKTGKYATVSVSLKAETDLAGLSRFMFLFDQASLMQRIKSLKITSSGTQGNPRLTVALTAEGMSVDGSELKTELFPRTLLEQMLPVDGEEVFVTENDRFPVQQDFLARIGTEVMRVSKVGGDNWLVQRGAEGTHPTQHDINDVVELMPIAWDKRDNTFDVYDPLLASSPFTTPTPPKQWTPLLKGVDDQSVFLGDEVLVAATADGLNPELGDPIFTLLESPEGMTIDGSTGEIKWPTTPEMEVGDYEARVKLTQSANSELNVESSFTVTVKIRNTAPALELAESAIVVIGRDFSVTAAASDIETPDTLVFSFTSGAPSGAAIDPKTGVITWTPDRTMTPGDYTVEVSVSDEADEAMTDAKSIILKLQDDSAELTLLTGSVSKGDASYAWFRNRGTGVSSQLKVGDRLVVAEIDAEVVAIERRSVKVRDDAGTWLLALGETVRNRVLIEPASAVDTETAADVIETEAPAESTKEEPTGAASESITDATSAVSNAP